MCPLGYHHSGYMATRERGHRMYGLYIIYIIAFIIYYSVYSKCLCSIILFWYCTKSSLLAMSVD